MNDGIMKMNTIQNLNNLNSVIHNYLYIMAIVGINYFELRTFKFEELNIPPIDKSKKYTVELVEAYFHLLGIPVFSLGKSTKLGYLGDYLEMPANIRDQIDPKVLKANGKWYSFAWIYLLIITGIGFFIDRKLEENRLEKLVKKSKLEQEFYLERPEIGDTYFFVSNGKDFRGEVHQISSDSVQITVQTAFQYQKSAGTKRFSPSGTDKELLDAFVENQERENLISDSLSVSFPREKLLRTLLTQQILGEDISFIQFWLSKFDLQKCFCPENNCKGTTLPNTARLFYDPVVLKKVERDTTNY